MKVLSWVELYHKRMHASGKKDGDAIPLNTPGARDMTEYAWASDIMEWFYLV